MPHGRKTLGIITLCRTILMRMIVSGKMSVGLVERGTFVEADLGRSTFRRI